MKNFKSIDSQIKYLKESKNINFDNISNSRKILLDNNYYNIISCSKIKFVNGIRNGKHLYNKSNFRDWFDYYLKDIEVSNYLMKPLLDFERILNSRVSYYIGKIIEEDKYIDSNFKNDLSEIIYKADIKNLPKYNRHETWKYITKMEFGKMKKLIFFLDENKENNLLNNYLEKILLNLDLDKSKIKNQLNELNNLRNNLFHFTPLNIYICYGISGKKNNKKLTNTKRKKAINFILKKCPNKKIELIKEEFYKNSNKFIKIKNSQNKNSD
ncbi:MAG: Abi family protein [Bacilli bacterium]|nr:Abi family protein [Bacilli bacterium]